jgi:hypothetical protein
MRVDYDRPDYTSSVVADADLWHEVDLFSVRNGNDPWSHMPVVEAEQHPLLDMQ